VTAIDGPGPHPTAGRRATQHSTWVKGALHLFPAAWQDRYGAEFGALLDETRATPRVLFDVLVAAVDAHVHPTGPRRRWPLMIERLRLSELVVFASWVVFVVAGLAFQRMTEEFPLLTTSYFGGPAVVVAYVAIIGGAVLSLAAIALAGVPIAVAIAREAMRAGDRRQLALLATPAICLILWLGLTAALVALGPLPRSPWGLLGFLLWTGSFGLAAIVSTVAVSAAALGAGIDGSLYRRAAGPAASAAAAMGLTVAAVVGWGIALAVGAPEDFWGFNGLFATSTPLNWLGVVVVMAGSTVVAARAAIRARHATNPPAA